MDFRNECLIAAPRRVVWAALMDFPEADGFNPDAGMTRVVRPLDAAGVARPPIAARGGRTALEVVVSEPPERFVVRIDQGPLAGTSSYLLAEQGAGTRLTHVFSLEAKGVWRLAGLLLKPNLRREFDSLRRYIEAGLHQG
jgi:carbon monoxide dehydrogenase subunit G